MESQAFSGASLEEALKGDLLDQSEVVLIGMVKQAQTPGYISFTGGGCDHWIDIPVDLIERADRMGSRPCKDHAHPVFRLTLKEPKDPQARIYASLLAQQPGAGGMSPMPAPQGGGVPFAQAPGGFQAAPGAEAPNLPPGMGAGQTARLSTGGLGGSGGLGAWGCWESTCTTCTLWEYVCNGTACWWICKLWYERPCTRCIWPW